MNKETAFMSKSTYKASKFVRWFSLKQGGFLSTDFPAHVSGMADTFAQEHPNHKMRKVL